jgi:hypothetical protein
VAHLACFGVDQARALSPLPVSGPLVFVSSPWLPSGGLAAADAWCNTDAAALDAGAPFIALLATSTASAASRLTSTSWSRVDGVRVGDLRAEVLDAPIELYFDGTVVGDDTAVYGGADNIDAGTSTSYDCNDWFGTANGPTTDAKVGSPLYSTNAWFDLLLENCSARPIYCVQP